MTTDFIFLIFIGALAGAASGYLGSYMVLKRMSLVGDALSHVALPGMAIALTLSINPILGALVALFIAILGIWYLVAKSGGVNVSKINLIYLLMVGLVIALGVKFLGTLLTGALVIVPAAAAKNIAKSIGGFQLLASVAGLASTGLGIILAKLLGFPSGPTVVL